MSVPTRYQRVGAAVNGTSTSIGTPDYDTVGFPAYLRYDGGDWYQTNSIDFSKGSANPPTTGAELVTNGTFDSNISGWSNQANVSISWLNGELRAVSTSTGVTGVYQDITTVAGRSYRISATFRQNTGNVQLFAYNGTFATLLNYTDVVSPTTNTTATLTFIAIGTATRIGVAPLAAATAFFDNISVKEVDANYAPDKMSVFTGVRKLSDTNTGTVVQLSSSTVTNNGIFGVYAPFNTGASADYAFISKGTTRVIVDSDAFVGPETVVLTGLGDISGPAAILRRNSLQIAASSSSQGTGNYGAYVLNIGTGSGEYTGREYETIVLGRAVTATELANTEGYMEAQTFGKDMAYIYSDELTTATGDLITAADGDQIYMTVQYV